MAPFRFSLEQVLKYRTQLEDQAKVELARVEAERRMEQERVDALEAMVSEQEAALAALRVDQSADRWLIDTFLKGLRSDLVQARQRVINWTAVVEAARRLVMERAKDKKVLEKLKSTQAENYAKEENYREQKEFDETASIRFKASY